MSHLVRDLLDALPRGDEVGKYEELSKCDWRYRCIMPRKTNSSTSQFRYHLGLSSVTMARKFSGPAYDSLDISLIF
jgi:hypothetical protein